MLKRIKLLLMSPKPLLFTAVTVTVCGVFQLLLLKVSELLTWPFTEKNAAAVALLLWMVKSEMAESEPGCVLVPTGDDRV